jgi:uncharacterized YceG family protein
MPERSAEERERARLERERRRLETAGDGQAAPGPLTPMAEQDDWLEEEPEPFPPVSERAERSPARRPPPRRPGGSRPGGPRTGGSRLAGTRRHSRGGRVLALLALLLVGLVLWFLIELFQPFGGSGHGQVTVTIPKDASTSQIADILDHDGVISCTFPSCTFLFELRAKIDGRTLLSGTYHLKRGMSFEDAIGVLATPPPAARVTEVTITPGHPRSYIAARLRAEHVAGSYMKATEHSAVLNPRAYGAPAHTPYLEGFLFPDTYQLRVPISLQALVTDQLQDFKRRFATVNLSYARSQHLTAYDVLIVASLIQKEATTTHDYPLVASVIYNRLRLGMPLQLDSTTQYATGNYNRPLTVSQLHSASPWNTHTHRGLPPTPIDSPGLAAIQAAARPAHTNYLYFVSRPCRSGALAFSSSYTQQLVNQRRLTAAHGHFSKKC